MLYVTQFRLIAKENSPPKFGHYLVMQLQWWHILPPFFGRKVEKLLRACPE